MPLSMLIGRTKEAAIRKAFVVGMFAMVAAASLPPAATAQAGCVTEDPIEITSFDGTTIVASLYVPQRSGRLPALLSPHVWGGSRHNVGCIFDGDYVVLGWDSRGWPDSEGTVNFQAPDFEVKDVSALIDYLATRPEVKLDASSDPRVGIIGSSYGGAIALNAAAFDHRIDAVVADDNVGSQVDDAYPGGAWRSGWLMEPYNGGIARGARYPDEYERTIDLMQAGEEMPADLLAWWAQRGTTAYSSMIEAPTLVQQPATDTLFPLNGALTNYRNLKRAGTTVRLVVYCGGHLTCPYSDVGRGDTGSWFERYLQGDDVYVGRPFEWVGQTGKYYSAPKWPLPKTEQVTTKPVTGTVTSGGTGGDQARYGGPAPDSQLGTTAIRAVIRKIRTSGSLVGVPKVKLVGEVTTGESAFVYLELVEIEGPGELTTIDGMTTPVEVSGSFSKTVKLTAVAWKLLRGRKLALEITGGSAQFTAPVSGEYAVSLTATATLPIAP